MKFRCEHCGRLLSVAGGQAGKKGRCPQCKNAVTIPTTVPEEVAAPQTPTASPTAAVANPSPRDALLFEAPPADVAPGPQTVDEAYERLRAMAGNYLLKEREKPPERSLPWIIDIFLYPLNKPGMLILTLSTAVPLILRVILRCMRDLTSVFGPALILWVLFIIIHWGTLLIFVLYVNWYVVECIRDSAEGGIRAANTAALTPGFDELFGRAFTLLACGAACMVPVILYAAYVQSEGPIFWFLYGLGGFLFPMALLAVIIFESLRALNPVLVVGSILSTFLPYCLLAAFCYVLCLLVPMAFRRLIGDTWYLGYFLLFLAFYVLLVLAHLIGRFCLNYEEKLNWDA